MVLGKYRIEYVGTRLLFVDLLNKRVDYEVITIGLGDLWDSAKRHPDVNHARVVQNLEITMRTVLLNYCFQILNKNDAKAAIR